VEPGRVQALKLFLSDIGGEKYDQGIGFSVAELPDGQRRVQSIQVRHMQIHQDQVILEPGTVLDGFPATRGRIDSCTVWPQARTKELAIDRMVIHDQDAQRFELDLSR